MHLRWLILILTFEGQTDLDQARTEVHEPYTDTQGTKEPHIYCNRVRDAKISARFALQPTILKVEASLRQVDRMTTNWPFTPHWRSKAPNINYVLLASSSTNFSPFRSMTNRAPAKGHLETIAPNDPQITLQGQRYPAYVLLVSRNFTAACSTTSSFRVTSHCVTSAASDPQQGIEHYKEKPTPHPPPPYTCMCC